jgi:hypothetical protein
MCRSNGVDETAKTPTMQQNNDSDTRPPTRGPAYELWKMAQNREKKANGHALKKLEGPYNGYECAECGTRRVSADEFRAVPCRGDR